MSGEGRPAARPSIRPVWWWSGLTIWAIALLLGGAVLALHLGWGPITEVGALVRDRLARAEAQGGASDAARTATRLGPASDFRLRLFDGGTFHLADQRGTAVVVNFWASWCVPCRTESPRLQAASQRYHDRGVVVVGVDIQDEDQGARQFVAQYGLTYPTGAEQGMQISQAYGVSGLPSTFFVDRQGQIRRRWLGELQEAQLNGFIDEALR